MLKSVAMGCSSLLYLNLASTPISDASLRYLGRCVIFLNSKTLCKINPAGVYCFIFNILFPIHSTYMFGINSPEINIFSLICTPQSMWFLHSPLIFWNFSWIVEHERIGRECESERVKGWGG